ncbi:MAG: hypothetical protein LBU95_05385, partial [Rikenellaceae bacterium]|nr:hypothetical protein [Rikenellaceae bacterium]
MCGIFGYVGHRDAYPILITGLRRLEYPLVVISEEFFRSTVAELQLLPDKLEKVLKLDARIRDLSKIFTYANNFIYLGR